MQSTVTHSLYHSTVSPFPSMARPSMPRPSMHEVGAPRPNYRARRVVAAVLTFVTLTLAVGVLILLAGLGGRPASASQAEPAITHASAVHVASSGDSLWSIAQTHHGDMALDRYVDALIDLNGGTDVQIGQAIQLP